MEPPPAPRWDRLSALLLFLLIQVVAARLVASGWAPYLHFSESLAAAGTLLGLALGNSRFRRRAVRLFVVNYTLLFFPWQMSAAAEAHLSFPERILQVGDILLTSMGQFLRGQPVEAPLLFVALVALLLWFMGLQAGYCLIRYGEVLKAIVPPGAAILLIQVYDNYPPSRAGWLALFIILALLLVGRQHYLHSQDEWRRQNVFVSDEAWPNIFGGLILVVTLAVLLAWNVPASAASLEVAARAWDSFARPVRERLSNAVAALQSPYGHPAGHDYRASLDLGRSAASGDSILFTVQVLNGAGSLPRYYWRGRIYDSYDEGRWTSTPASFLNFEAAQASLRVPSPAPRLEVLLQFTVQEPRLSLMYAPAQTVWVSRPGRVSTLVVNAQVQDVLAWEAHPPLEGGERYRAQAEILNPSLQQLRAAGTLYPQWVTERYLQVPAALRPELEALARNITEGQTNPYERAAAITRYLRTHMEYSSNLPPLPPGRDPLLWALLDYKQGFCNYYASAEVLLLRSIGVPARLAVGFAEGERAGNAYTVREHDAHAWPEVYFPGLGWVEFEPTAIQQPLIRPPVLPQEGESRSAAVPRSPREPPQEALEMAADASASPAHPGAAQSRTAVLSLLAVLVFALLMHRFRLVSRMPFYLSAAFERSGLPAPRWVRDWQRWNRLTGAERAFLSINLGLRWMGRPQQPGATPRERAALLKELLPQASEPIEGLVSALEQELFMPRPLAAPRARRAALWLLWHVFHARLQSLLGRREDGDVYSG